MIVQYTKYASICRSMVDGDEGSIWSDIVNGQLEPDGIYTYSAIDWVVGTTLKLRFQKFLFNQLQDSDILLGVECFLTAHSEGEDTIFLDYAKLIAPIEGGSNWNMQGDNAGEQPFILTPTDTVYPMGADNYLFGLGEKLTIPVLRHNSFGVGVAFRTVLDENHIVYVDSCAIRLTLERTPAPESDTVLPFTGRNIRSYHIGR